MERDSGFTLVEVLAASFILVLVLAVFIGLFHEGLKTTAASTGEEEALAFAQAKLEELQGRSDEELENFFEKYSQFLVEVLPDGKYRRTTTATWEIEPQAAGGEPGLLRVAVSVSWNEGEQQRQVIFVTLVAAREGEE